jgi:hypothetical protein
MVFFQTSWRRRFGCGALAHLKGKGKTPFSTHLWVNKSLDMPIERFFVLLRIKQKGKLDQLGVEISSFE